MKVKALVIVILVSSILAGGGYLLINNESEGDRSVDQDKLVETQEEARPIKNSPKYFVDLVNSIDLGNLIPITEPPFITGNQLADEHIRGIAERRGYKLRSLPMNPVKELQGVSVQPSIIEDWEKLQSAASSEASIHLSLISAFRGVDIQRAIFLNALDIEARKIIGRPYTYTEIADGRADVAIETVLKESSIPGFSLHHTGYAIDIEDTSSGLSFIEFKQTPGYGWIKKNDYENARRFGFVPSYPDGVDKLGPDGEPWELYWVGLENLE